MRALFLLFALAFSAPALAYKISGKVTNPQGEGLPFASVYVKGTTRGTTTNIDGAYSLELEPGKYEIAYRYIGYQLYIETADLSSGDLKMDVILKPEEVRLKEITVSANAEDPAYAVIRQAIKKRKHYLEQVEAFSCDVYIKGLQRLKKFPKKFMGQSITPDMMGIIDTVSGIVYLSESVSKFHFRQPDKIREEMISSKVSGSNQAFSYNQASDMLFNFYQNLIVIEELNDRGFVSPISANALLYYKYRLLGTFREGGVLINKIEVIPRRKNDPVFRGNIYIIEDLWRIHSTELYLTRDANIDFVDTLWVKQVHAPIESDIWMPISNRFDFHFSVMGFAGNGTFLGINSNYNIRPDFPKKFFTNEIMSIQESSNKKDSAYWQANRPVPLTEEEKKDYTGKDSLEKVKKSEAYLDSLDKKTNKFNWGDILLGYSYSRRFQKETFYFTGPIQTFQYNTVEGFNVRFGGGYRKRFENRKSYSITPDLKYGFGNRQLTGSIGAQYSFNQKKSASVSFSAGSENLQYSPRAVPPLINTFYALLNRQSFMKLYNKTFSSFTYREELVNGVYLTSSAEYSVRRPLVNHSFYSLFKKDRAFTSNNPLNEADDSPAFEKNSSLRISAEVKLIYGQKYTTRPHSKWVSGSKFPALILGYTKGVGGVSDVNYDMASAGLEDDMKFGLLGNGRYYVAVGKFLNTRSMYFMDYNHFLGNRTIVTDTELRRFNALDYYRYSTNDRFLEAHYEHNFGGFFLNKVPLIRKLKLKEVASVHYLTNDRISQYIELNVGLQRGLLPFRLQLVTAFANGHKAHTGFQLSIPF
jgi:hypothetical protein